MGSFLELELKEWSVYSSGQAGLAVSIQSATTPIIGKMWKFASRTESYYMSDLNCGSNVEFSYSIKP